MSTKTFNTIEIEDWTVPASVTELTTAKATAPGQDGGDVIVLLGVGGAGPVDNLNNGGDGTDDGVGEAGDPPLANILGDNLFTPGTTEYDIGELDGNDVELYGRGGHGKTAGGGGGSYTNLIVGPFAATLLIGTDSVIFTVHDLVHGDQIYTANKGSDAVGNTPGTGGISTNNGDANSYIQLETPGGNGTATTYGANGGGGGGCWGKVNSIVVVPGNTIRCVRDSTKTELRLNPTGANTLILKTTGQDSLLGVTSSSAVASTNDGGLGGAQDGDLGGKGATAATETNAGTDGGDEGITPEGMDGADGINPGDGGDGAGGGTDGKNGGAGRLGFAVLTYQGNAAGKAASFLLLN